MNDIAINRNFEPASRRRGRRFPYAILNSAVALAIAGLGIFYLVEVNGTVAHGYEISAAQKRIAALESEVQSNQVKLTERETVGSLAAQAAALGMVPMGTVEYVGASAPGVALR